MGDGRLTVTDRARRACPWRLAMTPMTAARHARRSVDRKSWAHRAVGGGVDATVKVLLVSGSLRAASTCTAALRTAATVAPKGVETWWYGDLGVLPPLNPDLDVAPLRGPAGELRRLVRATDAVFLSTPEYAGGLPGSLKNLLDWLIGDDHPRSIHHKPVGWLNVSSRGAAGAHAALRTVLGYASATLVGPACADVPITQAQIGSDGLVADPAVRRQVGAALEALAAAARR